VGVSGRRTVILLPSVFTRMSKAASVTSRRDMYACVGVYILSLLEKRNGHGVACRLRVFKRIRQLGKSSLLRGKCRRLLPAKCSSEANVSFLTIERTNVSHKKLRPCFITRYKNRWGGMNSHETRSARKYKRNPSRKSCHFVMHERYRTYL